MTYIPTRPTANEDLSDSQPIIQGNFSKADTSFGIDHYSFSNATVNNGKHNQVTTPLIVGAAHPTTLANEPKIYAMRDSNPVGVINYSRGPSNAVPSPITNRQSTSAAIVLAPGAATNVLNFNGLARAIVTLFAFDAGAMVIPSISADIFWTGTTFAGISPLATTIQIVSSGTTLQVKNAGADALNNVYWTLRFHRLS